MQSVYGYFDGEKFVSPEYVKCKKNQRVLITILDDIKENVRYLGKITNDNYEILLEALSKGEEVEYEYDDPFFSLENVKELTKAIKEINSGKARLTKHELIEVEDER